MKLSWIDEFESDWVLSGKSSTTAHAYKKNLILLFKYCAEPQVVDVKKWLAATDSKEVCRKRAQAVRAFGCWCEKVGLEEFKFWKQIPVQKIDIKPQCTVIEADYKKALLECVTARDTALVEMLWSTGMRRDEIARSRIENIDFVGGFIVVPTSKNGRPRVVPISPKALQCLRKLIGRRENGLIFNMTGNAIRLRLQRLGIPSAHAWRRGWAVQALRNGVSETSVRAAAGWSSGAMVARYTSALSGELAVNAFKALEDFVILAGFERVCELVAASSGTAIASRTGAPLNIAISSSGVGYGLSRRLGEKKRIQKAMEKLSIPTLVCFRDKYQWIVYELRANELIQIRTGRKPKELIKNPL